VDGWRDNCTSVFNSDGRNSRTRPGLLQPRTHATGERTREESPALATEKFGDFKRNPKDPGVSSLLMKSSFRSNLGDAFRLLGSSNRIRPTFVTGGLDDDRILLGSGLV